MQAIKIKQVVNLTTGLTIPSGSIVVISEGYANVGAMANNLIPCNVSTNIYASLSDYQSGKSNIPSNTISDFNPNFYGLSLTVSDYETLPCQSLLIGVVQSYLETIYPGNIEVINL